MSEVKVNLEVDKLGEEEVTSYTLREIPIKLVHDEVISFQKEITFKRDKKYNLEQSYVEALKDWAIARKELKKSAV